MIKPRREIEKEGKKGSRLGDAMGGKQCKVLKGGHGRGKFGLRGQEDLV